MISLEVLSESKNTEVLSAKGRRWLFPSDQTVSEDLLAAVGNNQLIAKLLHRRGIISGVAAKSFLDPQSYVPTSPMELPDVARAIVRITQAIELKEHITIYGDYDVDGITGTSLLLTVLKELGAAVDFYIPNRVDEGYGLNLKAVSIIASKRRTKLIISCDCGVSNFAEINFARSLGVDTIVLDHHTMPELMPPAVAIIHPKLRPEDHPLHHLPGVGVAYKLCEALLTDRGFPERVPELLDFVTLGMIADLVPLVKENRYLVQIGLPRLVQSKRPGIQALLGQVKKSGDADMVGFGIAPRINAVGRLADARVAVELLTTDQADLAAELALKLQNDNQKRQEIGEKIFVEANQMIASRVNLNTDKAIAIYKNDWHHGVVGIVASRLVEKYGRPVFIAEEDSTASVIKGSARSIEGVDLYEVLRANEQLLTKFGGHKMAAGFATTSEKAEILCKALVETCNRMIPGPVSRPPIEIDVVLNANELDLPLAKSLTQLGPFGMANKKPIFCLQNLLCQNTRSLGKDGKHLRLTLLDEETQSVFEGLLWNHQGPQPIPGTIGEIVFNPESNAFNNRERLQLHIIDWRGFGVKAELVTASIEAKRFPETMPETVNGKLYGITNDKTAPAGSLAEEHAKCDDPIRSGSPDRQRIPTTKEPRLSGSSDKISSTAINWRDLRMHKHSDLVLNKAISSLKDAVAIFCESERVPAGLSTYDRTNLPKKEHLLLWQFPPAISVLQEILLATSAKSIYLCGGAMSEEITASSYLKKLMGVVRYTVSNKDGQVEVNKLAAVLGSTRMCAALGLTILQKAGGIDWYVEDGVIFVDLLGSSTTGLGEFAEVRQLEEALVQVNKFRNWCAETDLKAIQLAAVPNQIRLTNAPISLGALPPEDQQLVSDLISVNSL
jgi:single-stranded-DNA-specific exonuclease